MKSMKKIFYDLLFMMDYKRIVICDNAGAQNERRLFDLLCNMFALRTPYCIHRRIQL